MRKRKFRETRAGKCVSRASDRLRQTKAGKWLVKMGGRRLPRDIKRSYMKGCFLGIMHEVLAPLVATQAAISHCRDFSKTEASRKRFTALTKKGKKILDDYSSVDSILDSKDFFSLLKSGEIKSQLKTILEESAGLRKEVDGIIRKGLPKEDARVLEWVKRAQWFLGIYINYLEEFKAKGFSPRTIVEKINLGTFTKKVAVDVISSHPKSERIELSVEIPHNLSVLWDKLDLKQCIRNIVRNSIEHNPGRPLKISAHPTFTEQSLWIYLEFLTSHSQKARAKPLPPEMVGRPAGLYSSTGRPEKGRGTRIVSSMIERYGGLLESENTPDGPKFRMALMFRRKEAERMKLY